MTNTIKSPKNEAKDNYTKPDIVIFDLDGCIMNSDDFVLTRQQAWDKTKLGDETKSRVSYPVTKPKAFEKDLFSLEYLYNHQHEVEPYEGILDVFVKYASLTKVAIVTSRYELLKAKTIEWLKAQISKRYGEARWRQLRYDMYFNELKEPSLKFKKDKLSELMKTYNILFMIEDHPQVIAWAKSKSITVLVPATGYKNLNGKDLSDDNMQEKSTSASKRVHSK